MCEGKGEGDDSSKNRMYGIFTDFKYFFKIKKRKTCAKLRPCICELISKLFTTAKGMNSLNLHNLLNQ